MESVILPHLESSKIEAKPLKLNGIWTCERDQKLFSYYGKDTTDIYWYFRCLENARNVNKLRRKKYWINQSVKYIKRMFRGNDQINKI